MSQDTPKNPTIPFKIRRQDGPDSPGYWERFDVPYTPSHNVISCLQHIAAHPRTAEGRNTTPVVWDCNCLEEVCGACTMVINGRVRQSCSALIDNLLEESGAAPGAGGTTPIVLEPMSKFPVVRDLMVDRQRMFDELIKVKGWVPIDGTHHLGAGPGESPDHQDVRYALSRCMTCGCCLEACPQFALDNDFIGASAIGQAAYFNDHATGKVLKKQRLDVLMGPGGISDCGNAQNCVKVCPKDIPLTEAISRVGRDTTLHAIKKFFTAR